MKNGTLLWIDDEIELLRPHILFLESKDYEVHTVTNGRDAIDRCRETTYVARTNCSIQKFRESEAMHIVPLFC